MQGRDDIDAYRRAAFRGLIDRFQRPLVGMLTNEPETALVPEPPPRGGHTELALERFTEQDARIRRGGGLPACGSFYS